jgi:hypothetical protein
MQKSTVSIDELETNLSVDPNDIPKKPNEWNVVLYAFEAALLVQNGLDLSSGAIIELGYGSDLVPAIHSGTANAANMLKPELSKPPNTSAVTMTKPTKADKGWKVLAQMAFIIDWLI